MKKQIITAIILIILVINANALTELEADEFTTFLAHYNSNATADYAIGTATATDSSGTTIIGGKIGNGILVNSGDKLFYKAINNINQQQGTIEFWIKPNWAGNQGWNRTFIRTTDPNSFFYLVKFVTLSGQTLHSRTVEGSTVYGVTNGQINNWQQNQWYHIALTWGSNGRKLYVNGILNASHSDTYKIAQILSTTDLTVGYNPSNATENADAVIDELRLSNIQRTNQEILISADDTNPTITILSPTPPNATVTTTPITISGTSNDTQSGVIEVSWSDDKGNNGIANGTNNWSIENNYLAIGETIFTITATDTAGNSTNKTISITFNPPDTIPPTITILNPTNQENYSTNTTPINIDGTASDNIQVTRVNWSNTTNGTNGIAQGTTNWNAQNITLIAGNNLIIVEATDFAGNTSTDTITVNYNPPGSCIDTDGDGYGTNCTQGNDCNDNDATINPAGTETCGDEIDQDCSGQDLECSVFTITEVKCELDNDEGTIIDCADLGLGDNLTQVFSLCENESTAFPAIKKVNIELITPIASFAENLQQIQEINGSNYFTNDSGEIANGIIIQEIGAHRLELVCENISGETTPTKTITFEITQEEVCETISDGSCTTNIQCQEIDPDCLCSIEEDGYCNQLCPGGDLDCACNNNAFCDDFEDFTCYNDCSPRTPTGITAEVIGENIELNWSQNTEPDFDFYEISYGENNSFGLTQESTENNYTFTGLKKNQEYFFQVKAIDLDGKKSNASSTVTAQITQIIGPVCDPAQDTICDEDCAKGVDPDCETGDENGDGEEPPIIPEDLDLGAMAISLILVIIAVVITINYKQILVKKK